MSAPARPKAGDPGHGDRSSLHRFVDALASAAVWHRVRGDHVDFRCPLPDHGDEHASAGADWKPPAGDRAGRVAFKCHRCGEERNGDIVAALGLSWPDVYDDPPARPPDSSPRASRARSARPKRSPAAKPKTAAKVDKSAPPPRWRGVLAATHQYRDRVGRLVAEKRRYESLESDPKTGKRRKRFSWRCLGPAGGWVYKLPPDLVLPLYRLPELLEAKAAAAARANPGGADRDAAATAAVCWLVEGEKNADDLIAAGVLAVSAPHGADRNGWRPEFTEALAGTRVIIVADRDSDGKGFAYAQTVAEELKDVTASLCVVRTPIEQDKADASDHLKAGLALSEFEVLPCAAAHGAPAVPGGGRPIPQRTGEVVPFRRPTGDERDAADAGDEGPPGRGGGGGGGDGDDREPLFIVRDHFAQVEEEGGAVVHIKRGRHGEVLHELLNAQVRIVRRIALDLGDGIPVGTTHLDLVATRGEETVELERVPWDEFRKGAYLSRLPWAVTWNDTPSGRSKLANAITATSGPVPVVTTYGSMGWREIGGEWVYVHAGGGLGAAGPVPGVESRVSQRFSGFTLPNPPTEPTAFATALRGVLAVLEKLPARISAPVMGAPFRALLGAPGMSVFLVGVPGTRKSGLAALAQQVSFPGAHRKRFAVGAGEEAATLTALERLLWQVGEALLVGDDSAPDRGAERAAQRMNQLLRMVGNQQSKARGARDEGEFRPDRPPKGLLMLTGEDGASRESAESRTVYVPLSSGDIPLDVIKELSAPELIQGRNLSGSAVVRHVAAKMPAEEWIKTACDQYSAALVDAIGAGADPDGLTSRRADSVAELAAGWRVLLDAALDAGALDAEAAEQVWQRAWGGLVECLGEQADQADRRGLVERSADLLRSALRSGDAHLEHEPGGAPPVDRLRVCGWRRDEGSFGSDVRPSGRSVGWVSTDRKYVWLDPGAAFAVIERQGRAESDPLGITARYLVKALLGSGLLSTEEVKGRKQPVPQVRRRAAGARQRVWELPWSWLWPDEADDHEPTDDGGGGEPDGPGPTTGDDPAASEPPPPGPITSPASADKAPPTRDPAPALTAAEHPSELTEAPAAAETSGDADQRVNEPARPANELAGASTGHEVAAGTRRPRPQLSSAPTREKQLEWMRRAVERKFPTVTAAQLEAALELWGEQTEGSWIQPTPALTGLMAYERLVEWRGGMIRLDRLSDDADDALTGFLASGRVRRAPYNYLDSRVSVEVGQWVAGVDVNAQYLGAASSTLFGDGDPDWAPAEVLADPLRLARNPGYVQLGERLETGHPAFPVLAAGEIAPTPLLMFLVRDLGLTPVLADALYWPKAGRRLAPLAKILRRPYIELAARQDRPAEVARFYAKAVARAFLGGMLRSPRHNRTGTMRPDAADMLVSQAATNMHRSLRKATSVPVLGSMIDAAWLVGDPDVVRSCGLEFSVQPGKWKPERLARATAEMVETVPCGRPASFNLLLKAEHEARVRGER